MERIPKPLKVEDVINMTPDWVDNSKKEKINFIKEMGDFVKSPWAIAGGIGGLLIFGGGMVLSSEWVIGTFRLKADMAGELRGWYILWIFGGYYGGSSVAYLGEKVWGETATWRTKSLDSVAIGVSKIRSFRPKKGGLILKGSKI